MIDTDKYEGHTEGKWILGEYKGRPSISAVEDVETPTWVRSIARGLNPSQTADHALIADAPLLLAEVKRLYELHTLIGVPIPWKVDYGDGGGYDTFVADAVVWNYDDSGEWGLVNYNETRWMTLETAKEWVDKEMIE